MVDNVYIARHYATWFNNAKVCQNLTGRTLNELYIEYLDLPFNHLGFGLFIDMFGL
jgi:hypothetical protein